MNRRRLQAVILREFNEIVRDPRYFSLALLIPPFLMIVFGYGFVMDVVAVPLGVLDRDGSRLSRAYTDGFAQSESFEIRARYQGAETLERALAKGRLRAALVIPEDFERLVRHGQPVTVQFLVDGAIPARSRVILTYAEAIHQRFLADLLGKEASSGARVDIVPRVLFNPGLRGANFVMPGLVATVLTFFPALLTTLSIVREKESQSIVALYCSPLTKSELLLGKLCPYFVISVINFVTVFLLSLYLFGIPFRGSGLLLVAASAAYVFATCALGILISVVVHTQVAAIFVTMVVTVLPSFLYSGFFVPLATTGWTTWLLSRVLPCSYYLSVLRGVCLKGTGWSDNWANLVMLGVYAAVLYGISFRCFRKDLG